MKGVQLVGIRMLSTVAFGAAVVLVSACAGGPQSATSALPAMGTSGKPAVVRPDFNDAAYVKVTFRNNWLEKVTVKTTYSYPIFPYYFVVQQRCVDPNQEWTSEIGFQYPDGQVGIELVRDNCENRANPSRRNIFFDRIQYTHADPQRATIASTAEEDRVTGLKLCGHQTYPVKGSRECDGPK